MTGKGIADRFALAKSFVPKHRCAVALLHMMIVVKPFRVLPPGDIRTSSARLLPSRGHVGTYRSEGQGLNKGHTTLVTNRPSH